MVITTVPARTESDHERTCVELDSTSWFIEYKPTVKPEDLKES